MNRIKQADNFSLDFHTQHSPPQREEQTDAAPPVVTPPEGVPIVDAENTDFSPSSESVSEYAAATLLESGAGSFDRLPAAEFLPFTGARSGLSGQTTNLNSSGNSSISFNERGELEAEMFNKLSNDGLKKYAQKFSTGSRRKSWRSLRPEWSTLA